MTNNNNSNNNSNSNSNSNVNLFSNESVFDQETFYNNMNNNVTNNTLPINAVPAYPINNNDHSSGPSTEPQINNNQLQYYDNNYLVTNYLTFVNNYINTMNNSINYFNNSTNSVRQMTNELNRMHYNLDYYYYNLYRNNLNYQHYQHYQHQYNYNNNQHQYNYNYNNNNNNQPITPLANTPENNEGEIQNVENNEENNEEEIQNVDNNEEVSDLFLHFNQEEYQELSNTNINNCIESNINNIRFGLIGNPVNNSCAISQEDFEANEEVSVFNYCGHVFKKDPLHTWLLRHQTCPNCRFNILTNSSLIKYSMSDGSFKYFFTLEQFRHILANNIINRLFNTPSRDSSNNSVSFVIRR